MVLTPSLIDWLYLNEKQDALIIYPRMIDKWNVASLIVSEWEGYNVFIVTDHPTEFMNTFYNIKTTPWTNLELVPFPLIKYSDISHINLLFLNTEIDIILFDDARMLATISSSLDFSSINAKIIAKPYFKRLNICIKLASRKYNERRPRIAKMFDV